MSMDAETTLHVTRTIPADRDVVFKAWTDPEQMKEWASPEGATVDEVEVDLRVGGRYRIRMRGAEEQTYTAYGSYREVERPRRLLYTWDWEAQPVGETLVAVVFAPRGEGTEVSITPQFPDRESRAGHEQGWNSCLDRLERLLGNSSTSAQLA